MSGLLGSRHRMDLLACDSPGRASHRKILRCGRRKGIVGRRVGVRGRSWPGFWRHGGDMRRRGNGARLALGSNVRVGTSRLMVTVDQGSLDWWWLHHILGHMSWAEIGAAGFSSELSLHINTLLEQDTLKQRVLIAQHQTFVGSCAMRCLQVVKIGFVNTNGLFKLLDVFGSTFSKSSLCLSVALLTFFRGGVDLLRQGVSLA
jgi:hypothetical protein